MFEKNGKSILVPRRIFQRRDKVNVQTLAYLSIICICRDKKKFAILLDCGSLGGDENESEGVRLYTE